MLPIQTNRWGGLALIVGSVLFLLNKLDDMSRVFLHHRIPDLISGRNIVLIAVGQLALIIGLWGCYLLYARRCNRMGRVGLSLLLGGGVLLAFGHAIFTPLVKDESLFILVILGVALLLLGLILFGAVNLRLNALEHWQALPLVTGLLGIAGFFLFDSRQNPLIFLILRTSFALGLILLGLVMWQDTRKVN